MKYISIVDQLLDAVTRITATWRIFIAHDALAVHPGETSSPCYRGCSNLSSQDFERCRHATLAIRPVTTKNVVLEYSGH